MLWDKSDLIEHIFSQIETIIWSLGICSNIFVIKIKYYNICYIGYTLKRFLAIIPFTTGAMSMINGQRLTPTINISHQLCWMCELVSALKKNLPRLATIELVKCDIFFCIHIRTRGGIHGQIYPFAWKSSWSRRGIFHRIYRVDS